MPTRAKVCRALMCACWLLVGCSQGYASMLPQDEVGAVTSFIFDNQCSYDITVRGVASPGNANCGKLGNCITVKANDREENPMSKTGAGQAMFFTTQKYTDLGDPQKGTIWGQSFGAALEVASDARNQLNFDNQYSFGIPIGLTFLDSNHKPISTCPEKNLTQCTETDCYSVAGKADNCYFDEAECPPSAWKIKTSLDEEVTWCVTNDGTLSVVSHNQDSSPSDCPAVPASWVSDNALCSGGTTPICHYNTNLATAVDQFNKPLYLMSDDGTSHEVLSRTLVEAGRPGGAKEYQSAVNKACDQFPTQRITGSYTDGYRIDSQPNDRLVIAGERRKDHASSYEGDQFCMFHLDSKPTMMAGNTGGQCASPDLHAIQVTFCPTATTSTTYVNKDGICGGKSPCYTTIQEAINKAITGEAIMISVDTYDEDITLDADKTLTLIGSSTGTTTLRKAPKALQGSLTLQKMTILPQ